MSLDVYLKLEGASISGGGSGIFVREEGAVKEISREEWDDRFPGREPVVAVQSEESSTVYSRNITHNLNKMAGEAGIYKPLWRPDEIGIERAHQLIEPLRAGLELLRSDPARFEPFNPPNGWGTYDGLVDFVVDYLEACERFPTATVSVWR